MIDPNIGPTPGAADLAVHTDRDALAAAIQSSLTPTEVLINMYEADGALVLVGAMPGVMADNIEITVERTRVWLRADARTLAPKHYLRHEWHYGPYERMIDIPDGFEGPPSAHFGNGQLALRIERGGQRDGPVIVLPGSS